MKLHLRAMEDLEAILDRFVRLRPDDDLDRPLRRPCGRRGLLPGRPESARYSPARTGGDAIATKEEKLELEGEVAEAFPNGMFKVSLDTGQDGARATRPARCAATGSRSSPATGSRWSSPRTT